MAGSSTFIRLVALIVLLQVASYCSALTLPLNADSTLTNTTSFSLSNSDHPECIAIAEAPGYKIRFEAYGNPLRPNDCGDALIVAQLWLLGEAYKDPGHPMEIKDTRTFIIHSVALTLTVENAMTYGSAALFLAGLMEWGSQYGFSEVEEIAFIDPRNSLLALAELKATGSSLTTSQPNRTTDITSLSVANGADPFHDPFLYPIPTVPGFYIRFMTHNTPLPRYDCLRALEAADATLLGAYHQKSRPLDGTRTWSFGKASFTLTPTSALTAIAATLFVLGTMQLGSERGFVEAKGIFLTTEPDLKGQLTFRGTGRLNRVGTAVL